MRKRLTVTLKTMLQVKKNDTWKIPDTLLGSINSEEKFKVDFG